MNNDCSCIWPWGAYVPIRIVTILRNNHYCCHYYQLRGGDCYVMVRWGCTMRLLNEQVLDMGIIDVVSKPLILLSPLLLLTWHLHDGYVMVRK